MKKFILLVLIAIFSINTAVFAEDLPIKEKFNQAKSTYSNRYSVVKFFQEHVSCANNTDLNKFLKF